MSALSKGALGRLRGLAKSAFARYQTRRQSDINAENRRDILRLGFYWADIQAQIERDKCRENEEEAHRLVQEAFAQIRVLAQGEAEVCGRGREGDNDAGHHATARPAIGGGRAFVGREDQAVEATENEPADLLSAQGCGHAADKEPGDRLALWAWDVGAFTLREGREREFLGVPLYGHRLWVVGGLSWWTESEGSLDAGRSPGGYRGFPSKAAYEAYYSGPLPQWEIAAMDCYTHEAEAERSREMTDGSETVSPGGAQ